MIIQHNIMAVNAHRQLGGNNNLVSKNLEKLSSGFKINRAGDDAAGLAISEKMRAQIKGLETAQTNAQDGISLIQTAEGALTEVHSMLNRMVELATKASNGIYQGTDRSKISAEIQSLTEEIDRIGNNIDFNGKKLLDGSVTGTKSGFVGSDAGIASITFEGGNGTATGAVFSVQMTAGAADTVTSITLTTATTITGMTIGAVNDGKALITGRGGVNTFKITMCAATASKADFEKYNGMTVSVKTGSGTLTHVASTALTLAAGNGTKLQIGDTRAQTLDVAINDMRAAALGIDALDMGTVETANAAIDTVKTAIETVSTQRGNLGALQNRLEHTINNLGVTTENMTAAESRIRDVDMAKEMMHFTKNNVLTQAAQAMLAQANQQPQSVLQLLR